MKKPNSESKHFKLYQQIKDEILQGNYHPEEKIPGEVFLAEKYDMSRQTVRQALSLLAHEGILERRQGSGTYVSTLKPKRKHSWNVGIISTYISEYIFPSILRGMQDELSDSSYFPMISATKNRVDGERKILAELMGKEIDGLIVEATKSALPNPNLSIYRTLEEMGIPVVFFNGYYPELSGAVSVTMDDRMGGLEAVRYLSSKGHKKIGAIFKSDDMQGIRRYSGYVEGLLEKGLPLRDEWILWFNSENRRKFLTEGYEAKKLTEIFSDCTAIVCYNDEIAVKLSNVFHAAGYEIPRDKSIISFDNSVLSDVGRVRITSFDHAKETMGACAARKLVGMIEGAQEKSIVLEWGFSERTSVENIEAAEESEKNKAVK